MEYLIFLAVTILLLGGFFALTIFEARRGTRVFSGVRANFDKETTRIAFIIEHVDFAAYAQDEAKHLLGRFGHDVAHLTLQAVRGAERLLTRVVRHLRVRQDENAAPRETQREFVKTLADFKGHLEANRPEIPDVHDVQH